MINEDIKIEVPLVIQNNTGIKEGWGYRLCGLASLAMVLRFRGIDYGSMDDLLKKALEMDAYLENVGWKHRGLVNVAESFGLKMAFIEQFPKTIEEKKEKEKMIIDSIKNGNPVIASARFKFTPEGESHMVVVHGFKRDQNSFGFYIQDPDSFRSGSNNYFIKESEFLNSWRGGLLFIALR